MGDILRLNKHCISCGSEMWIDEVTHTLCCTNPNCSNFKVKPTAKVKAPKEEVKEVTEVKEEAEVKPKKTPAKRTKKKTE